MLLQAASPVLRKNNIAPLSLGQQGTVFTGQAIVLGRGPKRERRNTERGQVLAYRAMLLARGSEPQVRPEAGNGRGEGEGETYTSPIQVRLPPHLARFSVTLRRASCFLARFLAAASLAIFSPSRSLRPGSRIYKAAAPHCWECFSASCPHPNRASVLPACGNLTLQSPQ